jgi:hypothetical protein
MRTLALSPNLCLMHGRRLMSYSSIGKSRTAILIDVEKLRDRTQGIIRMLEAALCSFAQIRFPALLCVVRIRAASAAL